MYRRALGGNRHLRVEASRPYDPLAIGHQLQNGQLNDAVIRNIQSRSLYVKEN